MPLKHGAITGRGAISHGQTAQQREYRLYTHAQPTNLLSFPRDSTKKMLVPTQKPLALMEYLVRTYSRPGDLVLDPTMGSGTTGVACARLARAFIGMEMNVHHHALATARVAQEYEFASMIQPYGDQPWGDQPWGNQPWGNQPWGDQT